MQNRWIFIDDPYGNVREDYNSRKWDDAYWSTREDGSLIGSRSLSDQRNEIGETNEWGIGWARDFRKKSERVRETHLSKSKVERVRCFIYNYFTALHVLQTPYLRLIHIQTQVHDLEAAVTLFNTSRLFLTHSIASMRTTDSILIVFRLLLFDR